MAHQGYDDILTSEKCRNAPGAAGAPFCYRERTAQPDFPVEQWARGILPSAHTQIIVPIRREAQVIGLLLLEAPATRRQSRRFSTS